MKKCFKCHVKKPLTEFYKHPKMPYGTVNKCKMCNRFDNRPCNGNIVRNCFICKKEFRTNITEINQGGGLTCSRICYYKRFRKIVKRDSESPNWKGDKVSKGALHDWVKLNLGKPKKCQHCRTTKAKKFEWANKSQKYKRDLGDWLRLCTTCHLKYDRKTRFPKWKKAVEKLGWKVTKKI